MMFVDHLLATIPLHMALRELPSFIRIFCYHRTDMIWLWCSLIDHEVHNGNHRIRQSAFQTMTLVQQLPLVIGDKIPEEVNHWKYLTLLIIITKFSPRISYGTIAFLRILIEEKLSIFCRLYHRSLSLKNRMLWPPHQLMDNATLSKVELVKRFCGGADFWSICKTVAQKHQLWLCYQITCEQQLLCPGVPFSAKSLHDQST